MSARVSPNVGRSSLVISLSLSMPSWTARR